MLGREKVGPEMMWIYFAICCEFVVICDICCIFALSLDIKDFQLEDAGRNPNMTSWNERLGLRVESSVCIEQSTCFKMAASLWKTTSLQIFKWFHQLFFLDLKVLERFQTKNTSYNRFLTCPSMLRNQQELLEAVEFRTHRHVQIFRQLQARPDGNVVIFWRKEVKCWG